MPVAGQRDHPERPDAYAHLTIGATTRTVPVSSSSAPNPQQPDGTVDGLPGKRPRSGSTLVVITLVVAVLALVIALAGVAIAALALGRSDEATDLAATSNDKQLPASVDPTTAE